VDEDMGLVVKAAPQNTEATKPDKVTTQNTEADKIFNVFRERTWLLVRIAREPATSSIDQEVGQKVGEFFEKLKSANFEEQTRIIDSITRALK
jgi:hypothetical protein